MKVLGLATSEEEPELCLFAEVQTSRLNQTIKQVLQNATLFKDILDSRGPEVEGVGSPKPL